MKRAIGVMATLALVAAAAVPAPAGAARSAAAAGQAAASAAGLLGKHDRDLLAKAQADGKQYVTLLVAASAGKTSAVAQRLAGLGGTVKFQDDDLSYMRVRIPTSQVQAAAKLTGIDAMNLDEPIVLDDPQPEAADTPVAVAPPGPGTPAQNPYMPTQDIGAPQFRQANPTYDGRGVVIGILDTGIDLMTPELQTAKLADGTPARKIIDWVTYTDPYDDDDPTWVDMQTKVTATGAGTVEYQGVSYMAPHAGEFRIGLFNERDPRLGGELENDVNRDGNPAGSSGLFAVLWDTDTNLVWVDTNQNHSFADEQAMTDYKRNYDMGTFGTDNPATAVRESLAFVVQTDPKQKVLNIGIVSGSHGTHVAGIAAGSGFFGGAYDGAAPAAQIVSVRVCLFISGCTAHAMIEGMIYAAKTAHVDVINMSIGGLPALNDGNNTRAVLYDRLIDKYGAQMFISAGNSGPGINTVGDPSVASKVMSVGAYVSKDSWLANYGADVQKQDGIFVFSSRGPREDGGFKPDILAPGSAVSSTPGWMNGEPVAGTYDLPPGYAMYNGTSMAAPQATGGAALLVSAAKQEGLHFRPEQLRQAISSSARWLSGYQAYEQGNGLMQVGAAWELLKARSKPEVITSTGSVNTVLSQYLATPGQGVSIYEREGWMPGQSGLRFLSFVRSTGSPKPVRYNLSWLGNDGTFSTRPTIDLPKNLATALQIQINAQTAGAHSAMLQLDDPVTAGVDYQVMVTVIAALPLNEANNYAAADIGQADKADKTSFFFTVPAGTPALKLDLTNITGRVRMIRFHPYGVPIEAPGYQTGGAMTRTLSNPMPGTWEVTVDASRASAAAVSAFKLAGSLLGASVDPGSWTVNAAQVGVAQSQSFTFQNRFSAFSGAAVGTALSSVASARRSIAAGGAQQVVDIQVPAGAAALSVKIGGASDAGADLDLYLFDCTSGSCALVGASAGGTAEEAVTVGSPQAGLWKALIDPYAVPSGSTGYDYKDVITHPMYGAVTVSDALAVHANLQSWTAAASVTAGAPPEAGRYLEGFVQVRSGSTVIGSAPVDVLSVTP